MRTVAILISFTCWVNGFVQAQTTQPSTADVVGALSKLSPSKKTIYWTDQTDTRSAWLTQDLIAMGELARVCGAVSVAGEWLEDETWRRAMLAKRLHRTKLSVNCWPWSRKGVPRKASDNNGVDPRTDTQSPWIMQEALYMRGWMQQVAKRCAADGVKVDAVLLNCETWRCGPDQILRYQQVDTLLRQYFPDAAYEWYVSGRRVCDANGWRTDSHGTEYLNLDSVATNLYTLDELAEDVACLKETRSFWKRQYITPWVAIGCHYRRQWVVRASDDRPVVTDVWDAIVPPRSWNTYTAGLWLVKKEYDRPWYAGNGDIRHVILHPSPGSHEKNDPNRGMTCWRSAVQFLYGSQEAKLPEQWR